MTAGQVMPCYRIFCKCPRVSPKIWNTVETIIIRTARRIAGCVGGDGEITVNEMKQAVNQVLTGELARQANVAMEKLLLEYEEQEKAIPHQPYLGLCLNFSPESLSEIVEDSSKRKLSARAELALAAAVENFCVELFKVVGKRAGDVEAGRVLPSLLRRAIAADSDFASLYDGLGFKLPAKFRRRSSYFQFVKCSRIFQKSKLMRKVAECFAK